MKKFVLKFGRDGLDFLVFLSFAMAVMLLVYWWWSYRVELALWWIFISLASVMISAFIIYTLVDIRDLLVDIRDKSV